MRFAFWNIFGELKNAEQETLLRLRYCFEQQGHKLLELNRYGFITTSEYQGKHIEDVEVDGVFTYNTLDFALVPFADQFSVFFHWAPVGFVNIPQAQLLVQYLHSFDAFASTYEQDVFTQVAQIPVSKVSFIGSSVPKDFCCKPRLQHKRKLFYVGINFERTVSSMRYGVLLKHLDITNQLEIYGPKEVFGKKNLWAGFGSYKGEIPFDGSSIMKRINEAGVCLALNSPMHNDAAAVSNRTFEAVAAGAVVISDDNAFVRHYFGDSVFYINSQGSESDVSEQVLSLLDWINSHPKESYDMACRAQQIFLQHLTLDQMVNSFVCDMQAHIEQVKRKNFSNVIDIVCYVNNFNDWQKILQQLQKQYYRTFHLILVLSSELYSVIKEKIPFPHDVVFVDSFHKGRAFKKVIPLLKGDYFMFMDGMSVLHKRHIHKNFEVLSQQSQEIYFAYSGCYLRDSFSKYKRYTSLNSTPISRDEFLQFSLAPWDAKHEEQIFWIETIFSSASALFRRKILDFADEKELDYISQAVHYYLACCALIKAQALGRFTYALTTGYQVSDRDRKVPPMYGRAIYNSFGRSAGTYVKEFNEVFFKYTFEVSSCAKSLRKVGGEVSFWREPFLLCSDEEIDLWNKICTHNWLFQVLRFLSKFPKKKNKKRFGNKVVPLTKMDRIMSLLRRKPKLRKFCNRFFSIKEHKK